MSSQRTQPSDSTTVAVMPARADWFLAALLAVSLSANFVGGFLLWRNDVAKTAGLSTESIPLPDKGRKMPPLEVERPDGSPMTVTMEAQRGQTILYVFSPTCGWCERNTANLRALKDAARQRELRLLGLSLEAVSPQYLREHGIDFPVYVNPSAATRRAYSLATTPETFVISSTGTLENVWPGAYVAKAKHEIENWLSVKLPGLTPLRAAAQKQ